MMYDQTKKSHKKIHTAVLSKESYMLVAPPVLVAVAVGLALIVVFFLSGSSKTEKAPPVVCSCIQESLPQRWRIPGIPILLLRLTD